MGLQWNRFVGKNALNGDVIGVQPSQHAAIIHNRIDGIDAGGGGRDLIEIREHLLFKWHGNSTAANREGADARHRMFKIIGGKGLIEVIQVESGVEKIM